MTRAYTARAAVTAEGTRLTRLRSDGPLALRATPDAVYLVGAAAGPLGGDRLELDIDVRPGARLSVRSAATAVALPGPGQSRMTVRATVGEGAHLDFHPEPTVAAARCDHRAEAFVALAPGATLRWCEEVVLGRHREPPGRHTGRLDVMLDGVPLLRHELRLDVPSSYATAAVLGGATAVGGVLLVGPDLPTEPRVTAGVSALPLAGPGVLITATAADSATLRRRLDEAEALYTGSSRNAMKAGNSSSPR
ncbi:urease accessory protein UreD [Spirillospora sp. CA-294931]|uniref:urease accessory protein UreD n=1 Tax=Spirillospora sp. CA-294931 TaxID=3240042 RepID=UPI003D92137F